MNVSIVAQYNPGKTAGFNARITKTAPVFESRLPKITPGVKKEYADLRVFHHHIYEFKKGIRNLILTTEKSIYRKPIEQRLQNENIDYVIHDVDKNKINVYFGSKPCVDVVKTFNPKLNELTPEQDFMLGIMLGYDRVKQCVRYLDFKKRNLNVKNIKE